jgi:Holliday junction DNA helicase RuvA
MIAFLRGTLLMKKPQQAVIETHNVGYQVNVPLSTYYELGEVGSQVSLQIHTQINLRQGVVALYGFRTESEHLLFQKLVSVTGVGPTLGLKILSGMPVADLVGLIRRGEVAQLVRIPSLGKRNAERIIVELRDKLELLGSGAEVTAPAAAKSDGLSEDVVSALVNLGYSRNVAERAMGKVSADLPDERTLDNVLKQALGQLVK